MLLTWWYWWLSVVIPTTQRTFLAKCLVLKEDGNIMFFLNVSAREISSPLSPDLAISEMLDRMGHLEDSSIQYSFSWCEAHRKY